MDPTARLMLTKSTHPANQSVSPAAQNGNPALQPKHGSQKNQPKTIVPKMNQEPAKPPSELAKLDEPQNKPAMTLQTLLRQRSSGTWKFLTGPEGDLQEAAGEGWARPPAELIKPDNTSSRRFTICGSSCFWRWWIILLLEPKIWLPGC